MARPLPSATSFTGSCIYPIFIRTCSLARIEAKGANVDAKDSRGWKSLQKEAQLGNTEIVKLLLEKGANARLRTQNNDTALDKAARASRDPKELRRQAFRRLLPAAPTLLDLALAKLPSPAESQRRRAARLCPATEAVTREAVWPNKVSSWKTTFGDLILVVLIVTARCGW